MSDEINYKNNPLNGVGLKKMLVELTDYYGFDILFAYLNINCFKNNPSVASSVKFLKKTDWAREKVEAFYLYSFKSLPKASYQDSQLSPRDRIIPDDQSPGEPANLSLNDAARVREEREQKAAEFDEKSVSKTNNTGPTAQNKNSGNYTKKPESDKHERDSSAPVKRTKSTADNPWGMPRD